MERNDDNEGRKKSIGTPVDHSLDGHGTTMKSREVGAFEEF